NPSVATVNATTGLVTGIVSGTATISYSVTGACGTGVATATVTIGGTPSAGTITGTTSLCTGGTSALSSTVTGGTWSSSAATIASIDGAGLVTGVTSGTATITYSTVTACGSATTTAIVTVNTIPTAGTVTGAATICAGTTTTFTGTTTGGTWASSNSAVAVVSSGGAVYGTGSGTALIFHIQSNSCGADTAFASITVAGTTAAPAITCASDICIGASTTATTGTTGGTWTSSDVSVATISTAGVVTSIAAGTVTISYTISGTCGSTTGTHVLTIHALPVISIAATSNCGGTTTLNASGAGFISWSPAYSLSCGTCASTVAVNTVTTTYTAAGVDGFGCVNTNNYTVNGNRIFGHVSFSAATPDTLDTKVWLVQFNASDSSLRATDSTTTCLDGGVPYFEFLSKPTGNYMVKGQLIYGNVPGTSGYLPTYSDSTINWYAARVASHTSGTDNLNITMLYGTVPTGPGFIGGSVVSGAGKGTAGEVAERGMIVYLKNAAGTVLTYVYTDASGNYSFSGLAYGTYYVYPADFSYYTTPSGAITLSASTPSVTGVKFKKYTTSGIIIPFVTTGITSIQNAVGAFSLYPNPATHSVVLSSAQPLLV
ncbi:MAG: hypothetical protein EBZ77_12515, partial [Chitinophagia bacterium]|nr:hypothetical protein [Chitinophagia bacterium]